MYDLQDSIILGRVPGVSTFNKFAFRSGLSSGAGEQLVMEGTNAPNAFTPLSTAYPILIEFDSSVDGPGNDGALQVQIVHINGSGEAETFVHTLVGEATVSGNIKRDTLTRTSFGINRVAVSATGTGQTNAADIEVKMNSTIQAIVPAGLSVTHQAILVTPSNSRAIAQNVFINSAKASGGGGGAKTNVTFWVYNRNIDTKFSVFEATIDSNTQNTVQLIDAVHFPFSPGDTIWVTADTDATANIFVRFSCNLYDLDVLT